jgi:hypothetical protein
MQPPQPEPRADPDLPDVFYHRIRNQTVQGPLNGAAGTIACIAFVLAAFVLVLLLEAGADLQELLLATAVIAAINLVVGVVWVTGAQNTSK